MVLLIAMIGTLEACAQTEAVLAGDNSTTLEMDKQRLLRRIRFGNRELLLPTQLNTYKLRVENDELKIKISKLENIPPDIDRLIIDTYTFEESKAAVYIATSFAQIWSKRGNPDVQDQLVDLDRKFDDANQRCHPSRENGNNDFQTIEDAQEACSELHAIYLTVGKLHTIVPNEWPSIF